MTKIILLNGPPRAGKDTAASFLYERMQQYEPPVLIRRFSHPLKVMLASYARLNNVEPRELLDDTVKDQPSPHLFGRTPRQFQIALSEQFFKPVFGDDVFGKLFIRAVDGSEIKYRYIFVPDSGFRSEAEPVIARFGARNCFLVRIHREGRDFNHDSRGYLELSPHGVAEVDINNAGSEDDLGSSVLRAVSAWIAASR